MAHPLVPGSGRPNITGDLEPGTRNHWFLFHFRWHVTSAAALTAARILSRSVSEGAGDVLTVRMQAQCNSATLLDL